MAELRAWRGMSQQVFADRIGRSKSWVDKVERGVRTLDRLSVIETVAGALGVAPDVLLADEPRREPGTDVSVAVERIRAALARHDPPDADGPAVRQLDDQAGYAWAPIARATIRRSCARCPTCSPPSGTPTTP